MINRSFLCAMVLSGLASFGAATVTTTDGLNIGTGNVYSTSNGSAFPYNNISGGAYNTNSAYQVSSIGGGTANWIPQSLSFTYRNVSAEGTVTLNSEYDTIAGGANNFVGDSFSAVGGGWYNVIYPTNRLDGTGPYLPTIEPPQGGGSSIQATTSVIAGGQNNRVHTIASAIGGGSGNRIDPIANYSVIGGGIGNGIGYLSGYSVISGGSYNIITNGAWWGSINGGSLNRIVGPIPETSPLTVETNQNFNHFHLGWIGGGEENVLYVDARYGAIGGGRLNEIESIAGFIGGGGENEIHDWAGSAVIVGGQANEIEGADSDHQANHSFIGSGYLNTIAAVSGFVGAGYYNDITSGGTWATIAGGYNNGASGNCAAIAGGSNNSASGECGAVPGGVYNTAAGSNSLAAGQHANAANNGCFVWGDSSTSSDVSSTGNNQFIVRANGGIWLGTTSSPSFSSGFLNTSTGGYLSSGGMWMSTSDRDRKENFQQVNHRELLKRVAELPISSWNYTNENSSVRHIGPTAQDFVAAFKVGADDKHIGSLDEGGVALAAIKGLAELVEEKDAQLRSLTERLNTLEKLVSSK